jgi:hypothetical protein
MRRPHGRTGSGFKPRLGPRDENRGWKPLPLLNSTALATPAEQAPTPVSEDAPLWAAWVAYPAYRAKNKKVNTYIERVQDRFSLGPFTIRRMTVAL